MRKKRYDLQLFAEGGGDGADAALAALEMMDFEGVEKVRDRVARNGTLLDQLTAAQQQLAQATAIIDQLTAQMANLSGQTAAANAQEMEKATGGRPGSADAKTTTNGLGQAVGSNAAPLATAAAARAMNVTNPNR